MLTKPSINALIRRKMLWRVSLVLVFVSVLFLIVSVLSVRYHLKAMESGIEQTCQGMQSFISAEYLIGNEKAIQVMLSEKVTENSLVFAYVWLRPGSQHVAVPGMHWLVPFSWNYYCTIHLPNNAYGHLKVEGKVLAGMPIVLELLRWAGLILLLIFVLMLILYPIVRRIPEQLFIRPLNELLHLLMRGGSERFNTEAQEASLLQSREMAEVHQKITQLVCSLNEHAKESALNEVSAQVAHDIRSPLAALDIAVSELNQIPTSQRDLIRNATQRINDIANNLLSAYRTNRDHEVRDDSLKPEMLALLVLRLLSEKRVQFKHHNIRWISEIDDATQGLFVSLKAVEFSRVFSNLMNNAIESLPEKKRGKLCLRLFLQERCVKLSIEDNGNGIDAALLPKVLTGGVSVGKKDGSGIGLSSAIKLIEGWGAQFNIDSQVGKGTQVSITVQTVSPPCWFQKNIVVKSGMRVVILDDDRSIHDVWRTRFASFVIDDEIIIKNCYTDSQLKRWLASVPDDVPTIYLVDYEMSPSKTGLDVIQSFGIAHSSILVTSHFEEEKVREKCLVLGVGLMPKQYAQFIPILCEGSMSPCDLVLIDDDASLTDAWRAWADINNKCIKVYHTEQELMAEIEQVSYKTPFYIDANLAGESGVELSKRLFEKGYTQLYLATGYEKEHFGVMDWIKGVVGKEPPIFD